MSALEEMIHAANVLENDLIEAAADSAVAACKAAGTLSLMPAPHLPTSGLLLFVHPKVYDRIRERQVQS